MTELARVLLKDENGNPRIGWQPYATEATPGVFKKGSGLDMNDGVLSVSNNAVNSLTSSGTITLNDNSINRITPSGAVTFTLPSVSDLTIFHQILIQVNLTSVVSISVGTSKFFNKTAPDLSETGVYDLIYEYDNTNGYWVCGAITKGAES